MKALRLLIILLCLLLLGSVSGFAEMTTDEALSEFVAAGMAYKEGRYDTAIKRYNTILKGDRVSGPLYYNLGNSYFKKKNIGQAVLNYERAKKFIPRDSDLNFNERYVHSKIDQQTSVKQSFLDRAIVSHIQFYTINEMAIILYCIGLMIGIIQFPWRFKIRAFTPSDNLKCTVESVRGSKNVFEPVMTTANSRSA